MNKKIIALVASVIVLGFIAAGTAAYLGARSSADQQNKAEAERIAAQPQKVETPSVKPDKEANPVAKPAKGTYVDYSDSAIANANKTRLLFFHAPWCPQCRMIDGDIVRDGVPNDVTVVKIDYDSNQALRAKYGVTLQTTFVKVDENGELIEKYVAYSQPTFASVKENLL